MYTLKNKRNSGITLIALVITIIVLLILAGVSITMITGNNSILKQATSASRETTHANVYEQLQLKAAEYYLGKNSGDVTEGTLIAYLQSGSKPTISEELGEGSGKYQIYVENLLGTTPIYGKGTASGSDTSTYKDVYILEKVESPEGASINNTKIASTKPIRIAANSQASGQSINYTVKYYGTETGSSNGKTIGNIGDTEGVSLSDIEKLKIYFNGNTYDNLHEDTESGKEVWKDNPQIGVKGKDLSFIMVEGYESEDGKYFYAYIKYKTKIYKVKRNNSESYTYTDDIVEATLTGTKGLGKLDGKDVFITEDGIITDLWSKVEDDEYGTLYVIGVLNDKDYYKPDGTLVRLEHYIYVDVGSSKNIKETDFIYKIYKVAEDEDLEYISNDTNIATVDSEGNVTGINGGDTKLTITGKKSGKTIDVMIRVQRPIN